MAHNIGELLKRFRVERELTQTDIANLLNYNTSTISRIERNQITATSEFIEKFIEKVELIESETLTLSSTIASNANEKRDWGTCRNVLRFYGRSFQIEQLYDWVNDNDVNLIGIFGMGGIGKTSIAGHFVQTNEDIFDQIVCRDLSIPYSALEFVGTLIRSLTDEIKELPTNLGQAMLDLTHILRSKHCLIMLDNFETIMDNNAVGHFLPEFQEYERVLRSLATGQHQSTILLTSRMQPKVITPHNNGMVQLLNLDGLEMEACQQILDKKGVVVSENQLSELAGRFSGNPMALEIVADVILESYQGDVATYLEEWPSAQDLFHDILPKHLEGFSKDEIEILLWLAVKRQPLTAVALNELIEPKLGIGNISANIRKLTNRSLIQGEYHGASLHNVIMEYMHHHLQEMIGDEFSKNNHVCLSYFNLIDTQAPEYVQQAQRRDMLQPVSQLLQRQLGSVEQAKSTLLKLLADLQQGVVQQQLRYLAGNIINLLIDMDCELNELDLSGLPIRHVDFREVDLLSTNFEGAALQDCLFQEMFGHVLKVSFSPNGSFYAIATANGQVHIWDAQTNQKVHIIEVDTNWVRSFDWHPKNPWLLTASSGGVTPLIKVWDLTTGKQRQVFTGHRSRIRTICYGKDGNLIISGSEDNTVKIWDENGAILKSLTHDFSIWAIAIHPTETWVAVAGADATFWLCDYELGEVVKRYEGHTDWVTAVTFNSDGTKIASGSRDGTARIWDTKEGDSFVSLSGHEGWVRDIAFLDKTKQLVTTGADGTLRYWDAVYQKPIETIHAHEALVESIAVSPDGARIMTGSQNNEVKIWESGECVYRLIGHKNPFWSVQFSPDGRSLLSGSSDGIMREWHWSGKQLNRLFEDHHDWVKGVAYHPALPIVASGSSDQTVKIWDRSTGQLLNTLEGHTSWISAVAFNSNGRYLASCSGDGTVRLWHGRTGEAESVLTGANGRLWMVKFSPNGRYVVSSNDKNQILVWETRTGQLLPPMEKHTESVYALAFSDDRQILYSGGDDGNLHLWDTESWQHKESIPFANPASIWSIAVQMYGDYIALGLMDGSVRLIDINMQQEVHRFDIGSYPIWSVTFSPDGQYIASCGDGEKIPVWNVNSRSLEVQLQAKRPYEDLNINQVKGLTNAQIKTLVALGAKAM